MVWADLDGGEEFREAGRLGARLKGCIRVGTGSLGNPRFMDILGRLLCQKADPNIETLTIKSNLCLLKFFKLCLSVLTSIYIYS
jgi:hypothetical protein